VSRLVLKHSGGQSDGRLAVENNSILDFLEILGPLTLMYDIAYLGVKLMKSQPATSQLSRSQGTTSTGTLFIADGCLLFGTTKLRFRPKVRQH
jgi:hypothetical protein